MFKINQTTLSAIAALLCGAVATFALAIESDQSATSFKVPSGNPDATSLSDEVKGDPIDPKIPTDPVWTRLAPGEFHLHQVVLSGWTIFSLTAASENTVIDVYIYDAEWVALAEFDSTGCGAFLQIEPQMVNVVIHNTSRRSANQYILNVFNVY